MRAPSSRPSAADDHAHTRIVSTTCRLDVVRIGRPLVSNMAKVYGQQLTDSVPVAGQECLHDRPVFACGCSKSMSRCLNEAVESRLVAQVSHDITKTPVAMQFEQC